MPSSTKDKLAKLEKLLYESVHGEVDLGLVLFVFLISVLSSLASGLLFTPENISQTPTGIVFVALAISIAYLISYLVKFGVFYLIIRARGRLIDPRKIFGGIILCHIPRTLFIWASLFIPGFFVIDKSIYVGYGMTSPSFFLRSYVSSPIILQALNVFDFFNLATLVLLSLFLRKLSNLNIAQCFLINLILDLLIQFLSSLGAHYSNN